MSTTSMPVGNVRYVKELYPRLEHDEAAIENYRAAIDRLDPIVIARGGVLVDGYHRWQAHIREDLTMIQAVDLGDMSDEDILRESIRRNAVGKVQLSKSDKARLAKTLWSSFNRETAVTEIADLLSASERSVEMWTKEARDAAKAELQAEAWSLWLDCLTERQIAERVHGDPDKQKTINNWLSNQRSVADFTQPPDTQQHFDVWKLGGDDDSAYFGRLPAGLVENLLWLYTESFQTVFDPFAGRGTTVNVSKRMGRRVWAADLQGNEWDKTLPIHEHDITTGWPDGAPSKVDFVLLDPPYWQQAAGRYSDEPDDLANMTYDGFMAAWESVVKICAERLADGGRLAFIISPTQLDDGAVIDHAFAMAGVCVDLGLEVERRIIVPYNTQQATGQQVTWARDNKRLLKLYRDLVVLRA